MDYGIPPALDPNYVPPGSVPPGLDPNYGSNGQPTSIGPDGQPHYTTGTDTSVLPGRTTVTPDGGPLPTGSAGSPGLSNSVSPSILQQVLSALGGSGGKPGGQSPLGSVLSGAAKSANDTNLANDRNQVSRSAVQNQANVNAVTLPDKRLKSSILASVLSNYQPAGVKWGGPGSGLRGEVPTYTGGVTGGLQNLDPKTKALVQQVIQDQLLSELQGGASAPGGGTDRYVTPVGQTSALDKILGGTALGVNLLTALQQQGILSPSQQTPQP